MLHQFPNGYIPIWATSWLIKTLAFLVTFLVLLTNSKNNPNPAVKSWSGCTMKPNALKACKTVPNDEIQMGEAWANTRVHSQKVAFFISYKPGEKNYGSEGGPYGRVQAFDCYPTTADLIASPIPADWCLFWTPAVSGVQKESESKSGSKKPKPGSNSTGIPSKVPGTLGLPMAIICPHNLPNCYSAHYYDKGGPLERYANMHSTYTGIWFPPKPNKTEVYCKGLNRGCRSLTMLEMQLHKIASVGCNVKVNCTGKP